MRILAVTVAVVLALTSCGKGTKKEQQQQTPASPSAPSPPIFPPSSSGILLVYTASVQGYVEPCGCTGDPLGGVARYAALIEQARRSFKDGVIVVDAGDLLFEKPTDNAEVDRCQAAARTELLVSTYARVGLSATTRGSLDDVRGAAFRDGLLAKHRVPSLEHGAVQMVERGGKKIALIGVRAEDADDVVKAPSADAVVVLAQMTHKEAMARAKNWRGVDVVVVGKAAEAPIAPEKSGDAIVVSAGWQSQHAGLVELHLDGRVAGTPLGLDDREANAQARKKLLDVRIAELDKLLAELPDGPQKQFQQQRREKFAQERDAISAANEALTGARVVVKTVPLQRGMAEEKEAAAALSSYEKSIPQLVAQCEQGVTCPEPPAGTATFVGAHTCRACHSAAYATWEKAVVDVAQKQKDGTTKTHKSGHAIAWPTLKEIGRDKDRSCVACHSAGFAQPGGACTTVHVVEKKLTGVQCESCHGPGSLHVQGGGDVTKITRVVDEAKCRTCHQPPHIPSVESFNYEERLKIILGPGHQRKKK